MNNRAKILVVDDEPFNVDYLIQELEDLNYDTVTAANGREALAQVEATAPDVILLDIMMPGMDGFEVIAHLMAHHIWRDIPVIIISALGDIGNMVKGIEMGAVDYLPKPFNPVLLKARIHTCLGKKRLRDLERAELQLARLIQQMLLPQTVPHLPGWEVAAYYQPAREVGGDFYDFLYFDDGRIGFIIGDVAGKGVPAALVMATIRTFLRCNAAHLISPAKVLARVNELLIPEMPPHMFVTCFYALLDPATGHLSYANAGHDLPYCRSPQGVHPLRATGMVLGVLPDMEYQEKEYTITPGEIILFRSDGFVEAHNPQREMFSLARLQSLMRIYPGDTALIEFLLDKLSAFAGPSWEQEDDITLVTLHMPLTSESQNLQHEAW
jgi:CheY-like chemotaxis protein